MLDVVQDAPEVAFWEACDLPPDEVEGASDWDTALGNLGGEPIPDRARKGRGAVSNRTGRFEATATERVHDGWDGSMSEAGDPQDAKPAKLRTSVAIDSSRTVIARNQSPDVPFDRSVNPYRGCEHGCVYCFARPTHAYLGLSPGLDFETRLTAKPTAPDQLRRELARRGYKPETLALGTNTDPYQPIEREMRITRGILEVLAEFNHPVMIVTKSDLVTRDLDILGPMAEKGLAKVGLSVTTLDRDLARTLEPRAPRPDKRLAAIRACVAAGVPTCVLVAPIIPAVNDHEIEAILAEAAAAGATSATWVLLRLPLEIEGLMREWLTAHAPDRAERVMSLVRQTRRGKAYRSGWGTRMKGEGPYAQMIGQRFRLACRRLGLERRTEGLDIGRFAVPEGLEIGANQTGGKTPNTQMSLF
jgi:DNA repair photolyase